MLSYRVVLIIINIQLVINNKILYVCVCVFVCVHVS